MRGRLATVSPWVLAAAFALLAFIIATFAINNYSREKTLMAEALLQKGIGVIRFLETGVRMSMRGGWGRGTDNESDWLEHVQGVIEQLRDQQDIRTVELIGGDGQVLAASDRERIGIQVSADTLRFARGHKGDTPPYRMVHNPQIHQLVFQVVRPFAPRIRPVMGQNGPRGRMMMENMHRPGSEHEQQDIDLQLRPGYVIVVELDLDQFSSAVHRQFWQIVILSVVLLLVGAGGWLSLITLQGFKGARSRLERIRAFNDLLVETLPVGLIATDGAGRLQIVNAAAEKVAGTNSANLVGKMARDALPPSLSAILAVAASDSGGPWSREETIAAEDGSRITLYLTVVTVHDDHGQVSGKVVLLQDVTNLRQLEGEVRRNERLAALGKMAAGVAHELRNPLSSIKGLAMLLKDRVASDVQGQQTAEVLVQEVERLNRSISELLAYARPDSLQLGPVSLHQVLRKATMLIGVDATAQGVRVTEELAADPDGVLADQDRINQVFLNLLLNGIQAMPDGGELRIATERDQGWVICHVEDTGVGIAEEHLVRVFDPYFTTKTDGTGLGLALSSKIIEEHGGTIALASRPAKGTRVSVRLPAVA